MTYAAFAQAAHIVPSPQLLASEAIAEAAPQSRALSFLTEQQQAFLRPQKIVIDDAEILAFQDSIATSLIDAAALADEKGPNKAKLTKLAIALVTLDRAPPDLLFVTRQSDYGLVVLDGVIGAYTQENCDRVGVPWIDDDKRRNGTNLPGCTFFNPGSPQIFGKGHSFFKRDGQEPFKHLGIEPLLPTISVKRSITAVPCSNG